jgi:hypothetical protein
MPRTGGSAPGRSLANPPAESYTTRVGVRPFPDLLTIPTRVWPRLKIP